MEDRTLNLDQLQLDLLDLEVENLEFVGNDLGSVLESLSLGTIGHGMTEVGASSGCGCGGNTSGSCCVQDEVPIG